MTRLENKNDNFNKAIKRLNEANTAYKSTAGKNVDIIRDGLIKRFEFTFELAWKTLREYLIDQGYQLDIASPKGVIAFAFQEGILKNESLWIEMLEARNSTSHIYGQDMAAEIAENISNRYSKELVALSKFIADKH